MAAPAAAPAAAPVVVRDAVVVPQPTRVAARIAVMNKGMVFMIPISECLCVLAR
jgi:hypothetical protein